MSPNFGVAASNPQMAAKIKKALGKGQQAATSGLNTARLWRIWRRVGEVRYVTTEQAKLVGKTVWDIDVEGVRATDAEAEAILARVNPKIAEQARLAAIHTQVAGTYKFVEVDDCWFVVPNPGSAYSKKIEEKATRKGTFGVIDPFLMDQYASMVDAAADVAEELLLTRTLGRTTKRNRTAQLLTVLYPVEGVNDPDAFEDDLMSVMTAPLADEQSMSVAVPNIIRFQGEWIDKWKTLDLTGPINKKLSDEVDKLVRQLAVQLDCPPEILLGMGSANHWSTWAIQEDNWSVHILPLAEGFAGALEFAIAAVLDVDATAVKVTPNPSRILRRRPTLADVLSAYNSGVVNGAYVRDQLGADESDAPTPAEQAERNQGRKNVKDPTSTAEPDQKGGTRREQQRGRK